MDALENAFADLQMHGGTAKTGVPVGIGNPGTKYVNSKYTTSYDDAWRHCGGLLTDNYNRSRYFDVLANGTTSYKMLEKLYVSNILNTILNVLNTYNLVALDRNHKSQRNIMNLPT